jgi:hypothetical protein
MRGWHIGLVVLVLIAYLVGVKYPQAGQTALSKVGM